MGQNVVIDVPMRDVVTPRRRVSGTQKLADSTRKICDTIKGITEQVDRITQSRSIMRAHNALQSPEAQAMRDRAAFDQAYADRNERQRQQLKATQEAADKFYGRAGK
ncbi:MULTISPECIES: hypothetical protein [unclassified Methylobacterium]|uniref:hypothetical protein n=1 Tax=unclassified Methylobacterium TaxID=2615210 RepID=UPI00226A9793|nr:MULTISPECIES: hypothetical protein [unclassified Methylobacterium]